jgi:sugar phosphate isomerase/epimerase
MSVSFPFAFSLDAFRSAEKLADKYDVNMGIHNHGGRHWLGSAGVLKTVFDNTSSRIGLTLDTAWALDAGEDPVKMAEMFSGRLYGLHLKDFVFDKARKPADVIVGSGNVDLPKLFDVLKRINFNGATILEYEGDIENPAPAIKKCVEAVKKEAAKIR